MLLFARDTFTPDGAGANVGIEGRSTEFGGSAWTQTKLSSPTAGIVRNPTAGSPDTDQLRLIGNSAGDRYAAMLNTDMRSPNQRLRIRHGIHFTSSNQWGIAFKWASGMATGGYVVQFSGNGGGSVNPAQVQLRRAPNPGNLFDHVALATTNITTANLMQLESGNPALNITDSATFVEYDVIADVSGRIRVYMANWSYTSGLEGSQDQPTDVVNDALAGLSTKAQLIIDFTDATFATRAGRCGIYAAESANSSMAGVDFFEAYDLVPPVRMAG